MNVATPKWRQCRDIPGDSPAAGGCPPPRRAAIGNALPAARKRSLVEAHPRPHPQMDEQVWVSTLPLLPMQQPVWFSEDDDNVEEEGEEEDDNDDVEEEMADGDGDDDVEEQEEDEEDDDIEEEEEDDGDDMEEDDDDEEEDDDDDELQVASRGVRNALVLKLAFERMTMALRSMTDQQEAEKQFFSRMRKFDMPIIEVRLPFMEWVMKHEMGLEYMENMDDAAVYQVICCFLRKNYPGEADALIAKVKEG